MCLPAKESAAAKVYSVKTFGGGDQQSLIIMSYPHNFVTRGSGSMCFVDLGSLGEVPPNTGPMGIFRSSELRLGLMSAKGVERSTNLTSETNGKRRFTDPEGNFRGYLIYWDFTWAGRGIKLRRETTKFCEIM